MSIGDAVDGTTFWERRIIGVRVGTPEYVYYRSLRTVAPGPISYGCAPSGSLKLLEASLKCVQQVKLPVTSKWLFSCTVKSWYHALITNGWERTLLFLARRDVGHNYR